VTSNSCTDPFADDVRLNVIVVTPDVGLGYADRCPLVVGVEGVSIDVS
jgi:hypothetical protein